MADKRPAIGLDLDGVCAQFSPKFIQMANKEFGLNLKPENQFEWDFQSLGLTDAQCEVIYSQIHETENFWMKLDSMPETDNLCSEIGKYRIYFITSRMFAPGLSIEDQTALWIRSNFFIANPTVIVTNQKGLVANALGLDAFIDDRWENCTEVAGVSRKTKVYLQTAPYNQSFDSFGFDYLGIQRIKNVNEFLLSIGGL